MLVVTIPDLDATCSRVLTTGSQGFASGRPLPGRSAHHGRSRHSSAAAAAGHSEPVIDRRLSSMRPVGILTNLNYESLTDTLGARILDRLQMDGGVIELRLG